MPWEPAWPTGGFEGEVYHEKKGKLWAVLIGIAMLFVFLPGTAFAAGNGFAAGDAYKCVRLGDQTWIILDPTHTNGTPGSGAPTSFYTGDTPGGAKFKVTRLAVTGGTSFTAGSISGTGMLKGTYYKFVVVAINANNNVVSSSKLIHVATKGGKFGNYTGVKISNAKNFKKMTLGKTLKIKAKPVGKKVRKHVGLRYESTNPRVAAVTPAGKVKAVSRGSANIIVYTQNGKAKTVKVIV